MFIKKKKNGADKRVPVGVLIYSIYNLYLIGHKPYKIYKKAYCVSQFFIFWLKKKSELQIATKNMLLLSGAVEQRPARHQPAICPQASRCSAPLSSLPVCLCAHCYTWLLLSCRVGRWSKEALSEGTAFVTQSAIHTKS